MPFQLSPGVLVVEKDLTNIVPAVASSIGAFAGRFAWGPVLQPVTVSSELELVRTFGKPNEFIEGTVESFFSAANFLSYSGNLVVVRNVDGANTASVDGGTLAIANDEVWEDQHADGTGNDFGPFAARYMGAIGNSIKISMADAASFAPRTLTGQISGATTSTTLIGVDTAFTTEVAVGDIIKSGTAIVGKVASITDDETLDLVANARIDLEDATLTAEWEYASQFDDAPSTSAFAARIGGADDELHIIVLDNDGVISGTPGTILEKYSNVSKAIDARASEGGSNFYGDVLRSSRFVHYMGVGETYLSLTSGEGESDWAEGANSTTFKKLVAPFTAVFTGGSDGDELESQEIRAGYDLFRDAEIIDVNLIFMGHHSLADAKYVIENIAQTRMDCVVFCSPSRASVVNNPEAASDIIAERVAESFNVNSSYGVMDSGWKYQYDKYNDKYRWIPLNADVAGLCARTDLTNDPWWSPGGLNRGQIKNVVKLAYKPDKTDRDNLYKKGINPVVSFPGEGTVLYGDKTLLAKPSAFDRINVRRLFIVLEKAIATASKYQLFEFNDAFTRAQFRNLVEPFLRDVQGRRGIFDFRVVCDESNNTGEVIDRNEFIADIYIKPARSINFITLNFIATRTGIAFEEIVGA